MFKTYQDNRFLKYPKVVNVAVSVYTEILQSSSGSATWNYATPSLDLWSSPYPSIQLFCQSTSQSCVDFDILETSEKTSEKKEVLGNGCLPFRQ